MRSSPLFLVLAASLCGCVSSTNVTSNQAAAGGGIPVVARPAPVRVLVLRQVPRVVVVAGGTRAELASFLSLNADCSLGAFYTVRIVVPPAHDTAVVERGRFFPRYPSGNPHSPCNAVRGDGMGLFYRATPGYRGPDFLEVQAISPHGQARLLDEHLDIR